MLVDLLLSFNGQVCIVSIANHYGLDDPSIEFQRVWDLPWPSWIALWPIQPSVQLVTCLSWEKSNQGMVLTSHSFLASILQMGWSYTSLSPLCLHRHFIGWPLSCYFTLKNGIIFLTVVDCLSLIDVWKRHTILTKTKHRETKVYVDSLCNSVLVTDS
jgi:hypothetical protein